MFAKQSNIKDETFLNDIIFTKNTFISGKTFKELCAGGNCRKLQTDDRRNAEKPQINHMPPNGAKVSLDPVYSVLVQVLIRNASVMN